MLSSFGDFLAEAGQAAGKLEIHSTSVDKAYAYAKALYKRSGHDLDKELPNFKENYLFAKKGASSGHTVRKDMPVIDDKDVRAFQGRLKGGRIDVSAPFAKTTKTSNPFPQGLNGEKAKDFKEAGLKVHDGDAKDDKVDVKSTKIEVGKLKPIQKQIYFDKSVEDQAKYGVKESEKFMTTQTFFIISKDKFIIDGHHRYLSAIILDPKLKVQVVEIDLPIKKLLPLTLAYGDAIGNKRNA